MTTEHEPRTGPDAILNAEECPKCGGTDAAPTVLHGEFVRRHGITDNTWTCDHEWHGIQALRAENVALRARLADTEAERDRTRDSLHLEYLARLAAEAALADTREAAWRVVNAPDLIECGKRCHDLRRVLAATEEPE